MKDDLGYREEYIEVSVIVPRNLQGEIVCSHDFTCVFLSGDEDYGYNCNQGCDINRCRPKPVPGCPFLEAVKQGKISEL